MLAWPLRAWGLGGGTPGVALLRIPATMPLAKKQAATRKLPPALTCACCQRWQALVCFSRSFCDTWQEVATIWSQLELAGVPSTTPAQHTAQRARAVALTGGPAAAAQVLMGHTDRRVKLTSEVVAGIKAIKLYAWEQPYQDRILAMREVGKDTRRSQSSRRVSACIMAPRPCTPCAPRQRACTLSSRSAHVACGEAWSCQDCICARSAGAVTLCSLAQACPEWPLIKLLCAGPAPTGAARVQAELGQVRLTGYWQIASSCIFSGGPILISLASFAVFIGLGHDLTPDVAFPALALFNLLRFPVLMCTPALPSLLMLATTSVPPMPQQRAVRARARLHARRAQHGLRASRGPPALETADLRAASCWPALCTARSCCTRPARCSSDRAARRLRRFPNQITNLINGKVALIRIQAAMQVRRAVHMACTAWPAHRGVLAKLCAAARAPASGGSCSELLAQLSRPAWDAAGAQIGHRSHWQAAAWASRSHSVPGGVLAWNQLRCHQLDNHTHHMSASCHAPCTLAAAPPLHEAARQPCGSAHAARHLRGITKLF